MPRSRPPGRGARPPGLTVLYEDDDLVVVDKPAGLLTIATDTERDRTAYHRLTEYVRRGSPRSRARVFIVHRLDRDTSGVLVFARTPLAKNRLQENWREVEKIYLAVVEGVPAERTGIIESRLAENPARVVYETADPARGKLARTAFRVMRDDGRRALLEITLLTGRKNQIRVQLAGRGHPVVGDRKYGAAPGRARLALHARSIRFKHPVTGDPVQVEAPVPEELTRLVRSDPRPPGRGKPAGGRP